MASRWHSWKSKQAKFRQNWGTPGPLDVASLAGPIYYCNTTRVTNHQVSTTLFCIWWMTSCWLPIDPDFAGNRISKWHFDAFWKSKLKAGRVTRSIPLLVNSLLLILVVRNLYILAVGQNQQPQLFFGQRHPFAYFEITRVPGFWPTAHV